MDLQVEECSLASKVGGAGKRAAGIRPLPQSSCGDARVGVAIQQKAACLTACKRSLEIIRGSVGQPKCKTCRGPLNERGGQ